MRMQADYAYIVVSVNIFSNLNRNIFYRIFLNRSRGFYFFSKKNIAAPIQGRLLLNSSDRIFHSFVFI